MDEIGDDPGKSKRFGDPPFPAAQVPNQAGGRFAMFPLWAASVPLTSTARRVYDAISGSANGSWGRERSVRLSLKMIAAVYPNEKRAAEEPATRHRSHLEIGFDKPAASNQQVKSRRGATDRTRPQQRLIRSATSSSRGASRA
jgi:hypothetical protein